MGSFLAKLDLLRDGVLAVGNHQAVSNVLPSPGVRRIAFWNNPCGYYSLGNITAALDILHTLFGGTSVAKAGTKIYPSGIRIGT